MWKVAICDDESIIRQQLFLYIKNLEREWGEPFSVACFASGEQLLEGMAPDTQILLLDIQMDGLSGMETACLTSCFNVCCVFCSFGCSGPRDRYRCGDRW